MEVQHRRFQRPWKLAWGNAMNATHLVRPLAPIGGQLPLPAAAPTRLLRHPQEGLARAQCLLGKFAVGELTIRVFHDRIRHHADSPATPSTWEMPLH